MVCLHLALRLICAFSGASCRGVLLCAVPFPLVVCGAMMRCAAGCVVCCAAAGCAVFSCILSCCAAAPLVRCVVALPRHAPVLCSAAPVALDSVLWCCLWLLFVPPRAACPLFFHGGALRCWCPWMVWLVPCCWWWFVVVPCSPALCPVVLCLHVVLCCRALLSLSLCCLCLFALASFKNLCKTRFKNVFVVIFFLL